MLDSSMIEIKIQSERNSNCHKENYNRVELTPQWLNIQCISIQFKFLSTFVESDAA